MGSSIITLIMLKVFLFVIISFIGVDATEIGIDDSSEYNHIDPCESIHCEVGYVCVRNQEGSEGKCVRLGLVDEYESFAENYETEDSNERFRSQEEYESFAENYETEDSNERFRRNAEGVYEDREDSNEDREDSNEWNYYETEDSNERFRRNAEEAYEDREDSNEDIYYETEDSNEDMYYETTLDLTDERFLFRRNAE